jgi:hypothetical protein
MNWLSSVPSPVPQKSGQSEIPNKQNVSLGRDQLTDLNPTIGV